MRNKAKIKIFILGFLIGIVVATTSVYAVIYYQSSEVGYDNTDSGLNSTNVQDALDELFFQNSGGDFPSNTIYRWSTEVWTKNQNISSFTEGVDYVRNKSQLTNMDSRAATYYLKYHITNNIVTEEFICFVITAATEQYYNGQVRAGDYCLKRVEGSEFNTTYYENLYILHQAIDLDLCASEPECNLDNFHVDFNTDGVSYISGDNANCTLGSMFGEYDYSGCYSY